MSLLKVMTRRDFGRLAGGALAGAVSGKGAAAQPNIVYILADDLGWGDMRCYNPDSGVPTPNMDQVAKEGMRFTDMHSPSSVCTPTRYGILTGRYCWRSRLKKGVLNGYSPNLIEPGRTTVPSLLKAQGYHTAGVGKWHLGLGSEEKTDYTQRLQPSPVSHGFDYYFGIPASLDMAPYVYIENDRAVEPPTGITTGNDSPRGVFWRGGGLAPNLKIDEVLPTLADKAVGYLNQRAKQPSTPFFLYFPLTAPHTPWLPQRPFWGRSSAGDYGDFVAQVDSVVGRVLETLEANGQAKNTLLVITSDNGADWKPIDKARFPHRANASWKGEKADIWDAGHRIPFLVRWPGKAPAGTVSSELACLVDLLGTVADLQGVRLPRNAGEDSHSLLPAIMGREGAPIREAVVHHSSEGMFGIRQGEWKLCQGLGSGGFSEPKSEEPVPGGPVGQLYNLKEDPEESRNLYLERPEIVKRLTSLLERYQKQGYSRPM